MFTRDPPPLLTFGSLISAPDSGYHMLALEAGQ